MTARRPAERARPHRRPSVGSECCRPSEEVPGPLLVPRPHGSLARPTRLWGWKCSDHTLPTRPAWLCHRHSPSRLILLAPSQSAWIGPVTATRDPPSGQHKASKQSSETRRGRTWPVGSRAVFSGQKQAQGEGSLLSCNCSVSLSGLILPAPGGHRPLPYGRASLSQGAGALPLYHSTPASGHRAVRLRSEQMQTWKRSSF